jgi:hypothetical protein
MWDGMRQAIGSHYYIQIHFSHTTGSEAVLFWQIKSEIAHGIN